MDTGVIIAEVARRTGTLLDRNDPMLIVAEVADIVASGHREELRASVDELRTVVSTAQPRFDAANMQQLGAQLRPGLQHFANTLRIRAYLIAVFAGIAVIIGAVAGGYFYARAEWQDQLVAVKLGLESLEVSAPSAAAALVLLKNNDLGRVLAKCTPVPQPSGQPACAITAWTGPPAAALR